MTFWQRNVSTAAGLVLAASALCLTRVSVSVFANLAAVATKKRPECEDGIPPAAMVLLVEVFKLISSVRWGGGRRVVTGGQQACHIRIFDRCILTGQLQPCICEQCKHQSAPSHDCVRPRQQCGSRAARCHLASPTHLLTPSTFCAVAATLLWHTAPSVEQQKPPDPESPSSEKSTDASALSALTSQLTRNLAMFAPLAFFYCIGNVLLLVALDSMAAPVYELLSTLRIPFSAGAHPE